MNNLGVVGYLLVVICGCFQGGTCDDAIPSSVLLAKIEKLERQEQDQQQTLLEQAKQLKVQGDQIAEQQRLIQELLEWKKSRDNVPLPPPPPPPPRKQQQQQQQQQKVQQQQQQHQQSNSDQNSSRRDRGVISTGSSISTILESYVPKRQLSGTGSAGPVAFHATISGSGYSSLGTNQKIVYNEVLENIGGAFHKFSGVFIAPIEGIYIFSASIQEVNHGGALDVALMKNGVIYGVLCSIGDQGSVTAVIHLALGDEVYMQHVGTEPRENVQGDRYTTFMGCLIHVSE